MKELDIKDVALALRNEIAKAQELTSDVDLHQVFMSAEAIVSSLAYLISPIADMEQRYRKLSVPSEGESVAAAEVKAKASDEYKEWRKYSALYDLGHEQINLLKKFREDIAKEHQRA